ncbi:MAG TPA: DUF4097 family beta strand repeat-containing protein [Longimicrobiales bacterium]|nr:DUF4097 family beta strand repeat-containing protein [Longimicrobiales bacterium]
MKTMVLATAVLGAALTQAGAGNGAPSPAEWREGPLTPDTVLAARRGDVLSVETWVGSLTVRVHGDEEVRISQGEGDGAVRVVRDGVRLRLSGRRPVSSGDLLVEVPRWMAVEVHSLALEVDIEGVDAPVGVQVLEGDLRFRDLAGGVRASTLSGGIQGSALEGDVVLSTLDGDIRVHGVRGRLSAEGTDGDLELEDVVGGEVRGVTVDGDVTFRGEIARGGSLMLSTHDGDVEARLPEGAEADVEVSTFDGGFQADFPVRTRAFQAGRPLRFVLGGGGVRVVLQSFDGDIRLLSW